MLYDLLKKRLAFFDSSITLFKKKIQGLPYGILKAGQFRKKMDPITNTSAEKERLIVREDI